MVVDNFVNDEAVDGVFVDNLVGVVSLINVTVLLLFSSSLSSLSLSIICCLVCLTVLLFFAVEDADTSVFPPLPLVVAVTPFALDAAVVLAVVVDFAAFSLGAAFEGVVVVFLADVVVVFDFFFFGSSSSTSESSKSVSEDDDDKLSESLKSINNILIS